VKGRGGERKAERAPEGAVSSVPIQRAMVLGDGGWGTTLALLLARRGVQVALWSPFLEQSRELARARENRRFLPGVALPESIVFTADPFAATQGAELAVSAIPTQYLRASLEKFEDALAGTVPVVSASKGLEIETLHRPSEIIASVLGERPVCVLSGPSHAEEVSRGQPASVVAASHASGLARLVQEAFTSDAFRVYTSDDPTGAELGGALKNVIALAAGISDGLGLGDNAKAALLTRGMAEMARFGKSRGARVETFFGLTGIGDLVTTCCSVHSRNRSVGEAIGRGEKLADVLERMEMVAEGVFTTKALFGPEAEDAVDMPIAREVHAILFENKDPRAAVLDLMRREPAQELRGFTGS
jgi:glycerol-3-phosphate dehydrogenase (NAD(P)+)